MKKSLIKELDELENSHWWHKSKRDIFTEYINGYIKAHPKEKIKILEIGAGAGNILAPYKNIAHVIALDPDKSAIEFCKKRGITETLQYTLEEYKSYKKNSIDIVIAADVLEHIENDYDAVEKIWSMLKKDGLFLVHVPANQSLFSYWDKALGHFRRYSTPQLKKVLKSQKFTLNIMFHRIITPYPAVYLFRRIKAIMNKGNKNVPSDFKNFPIVNDIAYFIIRIEDFLSKKRILNAPFGLSLFAVAVKK